VIDDYEDQFDFAGEGDYIGKPILVITLEF
jgi:hypothetical protein